MALKVGIQMFSVRESMKKDPIGTINRVAQMGYKYIELANLKGKRDPGCGFGVSPKELNAAIAPYGAEIFSAHVYPLDEENIDAVLEYHAALGTKYLVSKPFDEGREATIRGCELLNRLGEKCKAAGMQHAIHASFFTYFADGTWPLDLITERTDPALVKYELDTYWILRSGYDPVERMRMYGDRIILLHQKDLPKGYDKPININSTVPPGTFFQPGDYGHSGTDAFCEIGTGQLDLQLMIDTAIECTAASHIILEQDFTQLDEFESIELSMQGFRKCNHIDWS